jgi:hypothetical protein
MNTGKCKLCGWLRWFIFQPLCVQLLFNSDMSLEIDRLPEENEYLQSLADSIEAELN